MSFQTKCKEIKKLFGFLIQDHIKNHGSEAYGGLFYINHKATSDVMIYASGKEADKFRELIKEIRRTQAMRA